MFNFAQDHRWYAQILCILFFNLFSGIPLLFTIGRSYLYAILTSSRLVLVSNLLGLYPQYPDLSKRNITSVSTHTPISHPVFSPVLTSSRYMIWSEVGPDCILKDLKLASFNEILPSYIGWNTAKNLLELHHGEHYHLQKCSRNLSWSTITVRAARREDPTGVSPRWALSFKYILETSLHLLR